MRILSRPTAKPYRSRDIHHHSGARRPALNDEGHVTWDGEDDIENPLGWSPARRAYITVCAVLLVVNATFASAAPSGCLESISASFGVSGEAAGLTITLFLLGYCAGPLAFAPLSEVYGRRVIFYGTFLAYAASNFLCAFAPNFGGLLVGRFLTGTFVSAPLSNAPGVMADLWGPVERGNAMAGFSLMVWAGPALGPITSGFLQLTKGMEDGWRWSFYVILMLAAFSAVFMFTIPETYTPVLLRQKARRIRRARVPGYEDVRAPIEATDRSLGQVYKVALTRPWIILFDPISFLCAIYLSVVYLLLYMLFSIYRKFSSNTQNTHSWRAGLLTRFSFSRNSHRLRGYAGVELRRGRAAPPRHHGRAGPGLGPHRLGLARPEQEGAGRRHAGARGQAAAGHGRRRRVRGEHVLVRVERQLQLCPLGGPHAGRGVPLRVHDADLCGIPDV